MKHVKPLKINEDVFNIRDLDYIDAFADIFQVFSHLRLKKYIDRDSKLVRSIDDINQELDYSMGFDEWFEDDENYKYESRLVSDILKNYRKKL